MTYKKKIYAGIGVMSSKIKGIIAVRRVEYAPNIHQVMLNKKSLLSTNLGV